MEVTLNINDKDFPEVFKLKQRERDKKLKDIFKTGYEIHYPKINSKKDNEYCQILRKLEELNEYNSNESNEDYLSSQIEEMMYSIQKLTGVSNNSTKKGEVGEHMLEQVISQRYGDVTYDNKAKTPHSGDAWLTFPDGKTIMLESKNYNYRVNKDELEKMENDMVTNYIKFGIFVSWCSTVQNRKDLDIHTFYHNGETYLVIVISNLSDDINKLDLGMQLMRKLLLNFSDMKSFPWLVDDLKDNLGKLEGLINKNFKLRDNFYLMSNTITDSLNNYFLFMREYQYDIEKNIKEIVDSIDSTINESVKSSNNGSMCNSISDFNKSKEWIIKYKDEKMYSILEAFNDMMISKKDSIESNKSSEPKIIISKCEDDKDDHYSILKLEKKIGFVKVQKKKVLVCLGNGFSLELDDKNYLSTIPILEGILKNI